MKINMNSPYGQAFFGLPDFIFYASIHVLFFYLKGGQDAKKQDAA
jgi:hypothetical protein